MADPPTADFTPATEYLYSHPSDYPSSFVVREQSVYSGGTLVKSPEAYLFDTLEEVRGWLTQQGLTNIDRYPNDDSVIVEVWV
jgi:hypothetical protein